MKACIILLATCACFSPVMAQETAGFIDGTYVFAPGACEKLKALAAGGEQNIGSVPWYVTKDGISFWEGGCGFAKVSKGKRQDEWDVVAACGEEAEEFTETYTWQRSGPDRFSVTLTTPGTTPEDAQPKTYTRCDVGEIPEPQ